MLVFCGIILYFLIFLVYFKVHFLVVEMSGDKILRGGSILERKGEKKEKSQNIPH